MFAQGILSQNIIEYHRRSKFLYVLVYVWLDIDFELRFPIVRPVCVNMCKESVYLSLIWRPAGRSTRHSSPGTRLAPPSL